MLSYALFAIAMASGGAARWELPNTVLTIGRVVDRILDRETGTACYILRDGKHPQITCVPVREALASR
jgi:hypothetical protein